MGGHQHQGSPFLPPPYPLALPSPFLNPCPLASPCFPLLLSPSSLSLDPFIFPCPFSLQVVFSEVQWVGTKEQNPEERPLPMPVELQDTKLHTNYHFNYGAQPKQGASLVGWARQPARGQIRPVWCRGWGWGWDVAEAMAGLWLGLGMPW